MSKQKLATIWLDGCSGCHMSLLDTDERLIEIANMFDIVYSPLVDVKEFPENVDVALVEGAISSDGDHEMILKIRARTKTLVAFGDCAVTGNIPSMRNRYSVRDVLHRGYIETAANKAKVIPNTKIPLLRDRVVPVYDIVTVDLFLQGCPPSADLIFYTLSELAERRMPDLSEKARFG
jgi:NAD-reducing hydrogenase small subunit